ncbi:MAG: S41 family peptidase [Ruminococcus sp.]|jgi:carboxyl-terminal processing protease|nr:S41 family peptidase [Ruminococcus sp.]
MKKFLSILVAAVLLVSTAPTAFAEEITPEEAKAQFIIELFNESQKDENFPGDVRGRWNVLEGFFADMFSEDPASYDEMIALWKGSVDDYSYITDTAAFDDGYDTRRKGRVGLQVHFGNERYEVINIEDNSPAMLAGVTVGTILLDFHGQAFSGDAYEDMAMVQKLYLETGRYEFRGQLPDGTIKEFSFEKADYDTETVSSKCVVTEDNPTVGYIKIPAFNANTGDKFAVAWKSAEDQGVRSVIIDLRDNPGGYDTTTLQMLNTIIGQKLPLFYYKKNDGAVLYNSDGTSSKTFNPDIVILTNGESASASEVFTSVLRYHGFARSVGTKTFGKGIGQTVTKFNGKVFTVTAFEIFLPDGTTYNLEGIAPDVEITDNPETEADEVLDFAYTYADNAGTVIKQPSALRYTINLEEKNQKFPLTFFAQAKRLSIDAGLPVYITFKAGDGTKVTVDAVKVFGQAEDEYSFEDMLK